MRRLELDYLRGARRNRLVKAALAAFALLLALDASVHFTKLGKDIAARETQLARMLQTARPLPAASGFSSEEAGYARETLRRLATPWEPLFQALEAAKTEHVSLLAIEPNVEGRSVTITAEAKDYLAALTFVARLNDEPALKRVHLLRHEVRRNPSARRVAFTVSASWRER